MREVDTETERQKIELVFQGLTVIDYRAIRDELENVIRLCGAKAIVILVDEWSSVSLSIQPLLAEMIRMTLGISDKISLKIVALSYFTRMSAHIDSPQRIGLQSGIDITPLADLDELLNYDLNNRLVRLFLTTVAYKHSSLDLPKLRQFEVTEFDDYLCNELFENEAAYLEVVRASEGNPRDFIVLLTNCCNIAAVTSGEGISKQEARKQASKYFVETKQGELADSDLSSKQANVLFGRIFQRVLGKRQKAFLVSMDKARGNNTLKTLLHYRFIHKLQDPFTLMDENINIHEYILYSMDYGKYVSATTTEIGGEVVELALRALSALMSKVGSETASPPLVNALKEAGLVQPVEEVVGRFIVAKTGVPEAEFSDPEYLAKNCVMDDLLDEYEDTSLAKPHEKQPEEG